MRRQFIYGTICQGDWMTSKAHPVAHDKVRSSLVQSWTKPYDTHKSHDKNTQVSQSLAIHTTSFQHRRSPIERTPL